MTQPTDWRRPEYREQVFLDFYEFHLKYRSHPGGDYYLFPHLIQHFGWDEDQSFWLAFLTGNTQSVVAAYVMMTLAGTRPADVARTVGFWEENYSRLEFDTDRRHHKKHFEDAARAYEKIIQGNAPELWAKAASGGFRGVYEQSSRIPTFGRLSAFSLAEYLNLAGLSFECDTLLLNDIDGSKSHRNGLAIVCGLDNLDWHKSNPKFDGSYSKGTLRFLSSLADELLAKAKLRAKGQTWEGDVGYFTLESALCTYKGWHRVNRRYPNIYNDMVYDRIRKNEKLWPEVDFTPLWEARAAAAPDYLLLEKSPLDPGCVPVKQNHYRLTGEVIMMERDYPVYANSFRENLDAGKYRQLRRL